MVAPGEERTRVVQALCTFKREEVGPIDVAATKVWVLSERLAPAVTT